MGRAFEVRKAKMEKTNAAKSKVYAKYGKEIYMAAKNDPNPETNPNLSRLIEKAKKAECTKDIIDRAIKKAKDGTGEDYKVVVYEGFVSGDATIIVECNTDNVNRTAAEVRNAFTKSNTRIGVQGSVMHSYEYLAVVAVENLTEEQVFEVMLMHEVDVKDVETHGDIVVIYGSIDILTKIEDAIHESYPETKILTSELKYIPAEFVVVSTDDKDKYDDLVRRLEAIDDVQEIYSNVDEN